MSPRIDHAVTAVFAHAASLDWIAAHEELSELEDAGLGDSIQAHAIRVRIEELRTKEPQGEQRS